MPLRLRTVAVAVAVAVVLAAPDATAADVQVSAQFALAFGSGDWGLRVNGQPVTAPPAVRHAVDAEADGPRVYWDRLALALVAVGVVYLVTRDQSDAFAYDLADTLAGE